MMFVQILCAMVRSAPMVIAWLLVLAGVSACSSVPSTARVRIGGESVAYSLQGSGDPTVVLQSGLGDGMDSWAPLLAELQRHHVVFAYDRPGYGQSERNSVARDPCSVARELRTVLRAAQVPPPYLLVGHSLGGLYQYAYAKLYPQEVAGLVLLDPTHPDHWQQLQSDAPGLATMVKSMRALAFDDTMRREFDAQSTCLSDLALTAPSAVPTRILASSEFNALEAGAFEQMVRRLRLDWPRLLGGAHIAEIAGSGHYIQRDQPATVVQAIRALRHAVPIQVR